MSLKHLFFLVMCLGSPALEPAAMCQTAPDGLNVLDSAALQRLQATPNVNFASIQLELLSLRQQPSLLDDKAIMQSFIELNNLNTATFGKAEQLDRSEFDYPVLARFYKAKAPEILQLVSNTFRIQLTQAYTTGSARPPTQATVGVGTYDLADKKFPFVNDLGPVTINLDRVTVPLSPFGNFASATAVFAPVKFTDLHVDEATARKFVLLPGNAEGSVRTFRRVKLILDVQVLPDPPAIKNAPNFTTIRVLEFKATLDHVTVVSPYNEVTLGVLYP
jgi:hypothetical protein